MQYVVIASYLTAAAAFLVATALLALSWRGQRTGALLVLATGISLLWGLFVAYAVWQHNVAVNWLMLAEVLRYGAWLVFVGALLGAWSTARVLRGAVHVLWILLALYCVLPATGLQHAIAVPFNLSVPLVGVLVLALAGVVLLEQLFRNVKPEQRWALKFLVIALGVMFAYDIFLYSYATLYRQFSVDTWAARGFINALLVPLLIVAAARNPRWSLDVGVSRRAVFYSSSLVAVAFYIIATAIGGYYVQLYGGDWGQVAEVTLICLAVLGVLVIASSGSARSYLRVFLHKHFFSLRHDYREEWLRLTATLSIGDSETTLPVRAVQALAQIMDSPAGALFTRGENDAFAPEAGWNMPLPAGLALAADLPMFALMRERQWIYDLTAPPPLKNQHLEAPATLVDLRQAWLVVPLLHDGGLSGFVVLARARARRAIDWEDIDLLRTAGSQVASTLAQAADARRLAEARQFEGFNRLTAFLMHDLKNVAGQQSLLLQNAERHKQDPAFIEDMLATVDNSVRRISRLLAQLRGEAAPAPHGRASLQAVLDRALAGCRTRAPEPVYQPPAEVLWVRADLERLATVLGHVIGNAQDAATVHGRVALRVRQEAGRATIEIEDNGAGMDRDFIRNRLFQPFFTTKASRGMGIGAYQAREYVRSLGGRVDVTSTPGRGTVFTVALPLVVPVGDVAMADELGAP